VVRDPAIHRQVLERVVEVAAGLGLGARALIASPILGPEGNREFLLHLAPGPGCAEISDLIAAVTPLDPAPVADPAHVEATNR
jgi:23S rRNA (cytidine1920-2'-O)/16S rRNA (cytidine1409-2'-O)-methyltransferase